MTVPTPLEAAPPSLARGRELFLKREDVHELGAFKWRGALPTIERYARDGAEAVVTASTGNQGAATAWAARRLGLRAVVYAPEGASAAKLAHIEQQGADVRLVGADFDEAKDAGQEWAASAGIPFFDDGAEPAQLEGYGQIAEELLDQLGRPPAAVVVPVGNGALFGGVGLTLRRRAPDVLRVGVAAAEAPVMALSYDAGEPVECDRCATFADGLAVRVAIPSAVRLLAETADMMVLVSERELALAVQAFAEAGIRVEGAGAASFAALGSVVASVGPVVLVVTGRNIDDELWRRAVERPDSFPDY